MSAFDSTIGGLPGAPLPALGTDYAITSRDGIRLNVIQLRNWPLSNPVLNAINTKVAPSDLATINGQSLIQPGGNIVIATGGGTATWGGITGNLSDQTDLQNALNLKVNASALATVATTGAYADLSGRPTLGTAAAASVGDFATAAQGALADTAIQPSDITDVLRDGDIGVTVQGYDVNTAKTNVTNNFTEPNEFDKTHTAWTAVAFNATQTLNALIPAGTTTLTGNMTLNAVSNSTTGEMQVIVRAYTQDATGGRTLAYNTSLFSAAGAVFPQPSSAPNSVSLFQFTKMPDGKWAVQSLNDVRST